MQDLRQIFDASCLRDPSGIRHVHKPRTTGNTMVMDKGLGLNAFRDLLEISHAYIDFIKLGFGTAVLTPPQILQTKIELCTQYNVNLYFGGTLFEIAYQSNLIRDYFNMIKNMKLKWVEISDGTITIPIYERNEMIKYATDHGLQVITEVGKKDNNQALQLDEMIDLYHRDLHSGASFVIIEGRESGIDVGVYDKYGDISIRDIEKCKQQMDMAIVFWEAPLKSQQIALIQSLGPLLNFGNISPADIFSIESLRRGLRSDTYHLVQRV
ncbi:phosphosulfolactate synthase [Hazenella sp. IB182353]|uniref:phosphosulfolactate synthase n=1 Tax=Polycladospora coralii TaxID=2771432 RepID=UPI0017474E1F|nr:phosphosulfolactate synthase [Polycladospora coralii]MBS7530888.1 phosphosulfolactate synthase [Polycladospora coralii]